MRIGFDGRFITERATGNGVSAQLLLQALASVDRENEYVIYLLHNGLYLPNPKFQMKMMRTLHANPQLRFLFTFPRELRRHPVDIFHAIFTVPLLSHTVKPKIVLTIPEIPWFTDPDSFPGSGLFSAQVRLTTRYSVAKADCIVTLTEFMKRQIVSHFSIPEQKVKVIPWGVDEQYFEHRGEEQIEAVKGKFSIRRPYLLSVGDLHPRKNQIALVRSYTKLRERYNIPFELVLVGKPFFKAKQISDCVQDSSARTSIKLLGYVEARDLPALYQGAAMFVFPSLHEGFGLPIHEAMASGIPVITSNRDTLPEVAGEAALYIDPLDEDDIVRTILRLLEDTTLREQLIKKGVQQARRFSWRETAEKTVEVYRELQRDHRECAA